MSDIISKIESKIRSNDNDLLIEAMSEIVFIKKLNSQRGKLLNEMYNHDDVILPPELAVRMSDAATGLDAIKLRLETQSN